MNQNPFVKKMIPVSNYMPKSNFIYDMPARKVMEKNKRQRVERESQERQQELERVIQRVNNIYTTYEDNDELKPSFNISQGVEIMSNLAELENLLHSDSNRRKYLHQVTLFIVGYEKIAVDRLQLIQQVHEFFLDNDEIFDNNQGRFEQLEKLMTKRDEHETNIAVNDQDYEEEGEDELQNNVESSVVECRMLVSKLGELNNEMVDFLAKYAINKASNKGKKKLEKQLESAMSESNKLSEKLVKAQSPFNFDL